MNLTDYPQRALGSASRSVDVSEICGLPAAPPVPGRLERAGAALAVTIVLGPAFLRCCIRSRCGQERGEGESVSNGQNIRSGQLMPDNFFENFEILRILRF